MNNTSPFSISRKLVRTRKIIGFRFKYDYRIILFVEMHARFFARWHFLYSISINFIHIISELFCWLWISRSLYVLSSQEEW